MQFTATLLIDGLETSDGRTLNFDNIILPDTAPLTIEFSPDLTIGHADNFRVTDSGKLMCRLNYDEECDYPVYQFREHMDATLKSEGELREEDGSTVFYLEEIQEVSLVFNHALECLKGESISNSEPVIA